MVNKIRTWKAQNFPFLPEKWWIQLHEALNAEDSLEALSKDAVDDYDHRMREGLGILQILVMQKCPLVVDGMWSQVLKKVSSCGIASRAIADYLLSNISKKDIHDEIRALLSANLQFITPSTVWFLEHENFIMQKQQ